MFKINDWVQITPTPDYKFVQWYNDQECYDEFAGKIGTIENIDEDPNDPHNTLYAVSVDFPNGFLNTPPGLYFLWFREDHLIRSTAYDAKLQQNRIEAGKKLQEWEAFKKKSTDDALRYVFSQEYRDQENNKSKSKELWDEKTDPGGFSPKEDELYGWDYSPYDD